MRPLFPKRALVAGGLLLALAAFGWWRLASAASKPATPASAIISYRVNPRRQAIRLFWRDEHGQLFRSLGRLQTWLAGRHEQLVFATNGGMFHLSHAPVGLFIENGQQFAPLDTARAGRGNFYLQPNGVFYVLADNTAGICRSSDFNPKLAAQTRFATQSGPMLVSRGRLHPAFRPGSANLTVRNGVGQLPNGEVVFAMSKTDINFYDFAHYFRRLGCTEALYLDGFVSRTYLPEKNWTQTDGDFGVIIGVTAPAAH